MYLYGKGQVHVEIKECLFGQMGSNLRLPCDAPEAGVLSFSRYLKKKAKLKKTTLENIK